MYLAFLNCPPAYIKRVREMSQALDIHKPECMCDKCIQRRTIERLLKAEQDKLAQDYITRRGVPLPRPANRKDV